MQTFTLTRALHTRLSAERVSCKQILRKITFSEASVKANSAGVVKNVSETLATR